jgi:hypothetical protein
MTDLQRFFRVLVRNLAATDPARLRRPLPLTDIRDTIIPYRTNRRSLQLDSSEDYELVLMQFCAGQEGLARTEPEDVRSLFAAEIQSANPDLAILHLHENVVVSLEARPLAEALNLKPDLAFAPPGEQPTGETVPETPAAAFRQMTPLETSLQKPPSVAHDQSNPVPCAGCGGLLPKHRVVNFCPQCGTKQTHARCPECECEIEAGWRHCVACGFLVG